jgi:ABC-type amino acid transport substrate-binding protein
MKFTRYLLTTFLMLPGMLLLPGKAAAAKPTMEVRYWDWGHTPLRDNYQFELLQLVLDKTRPTYGDYALTRVTTFFTTARVRRELSRGKVFNVQAAPWRPATMKNLEPALRVDIDICKGLIGYRQLIIAADNQQSFLKIDHLEQLKEYTVGIGRGWVDTDIFLDNGFKVNSAANFETLLPMLVAKRFDFLSLSVIEADEAIKNSGFSDSILVADKPLLYMPLPFVFYVSIHEPLLAQRINDGLNIAMTDGSFDTLFDNHFAPYIQFIQQNKEQFLILENQSLPQAMQIKPVLLEKNELEQ